MNKNMKQLINEFEGIDYVDIKVPGALDIQSDRIKQIVNCSLDAIPHERARYVKQKRLKAIIILAAALILTTTTVWAASNTEFLKRFFTGDFSSMEQHVQTPQTSVDDGRFRVTLEQALAFSNRVVFIYSVEGLTEEASGDLMDRSFDGSAMIRLPENSGIAIAMMTQEEMKDLRTQTKRYYSYWVDGFDNPEALPISFSLNIMPEKQIEIPMDTTVEMLELTLSAPSRENTVIRISPMDIFVEKTVAEEYQYLQEYTDIFFRLEDGSIKTYNEFFRRGSSSGVNIDEPDKPYRSRGTALARDFVDITEIKSIIVGDLEYDISDPSQVKEAAIDEVLKPSVLMEPMRHPDPVYESFLRVLSAEEVVEKLGGQITFDKTGENAVVRYRDTTLEIRNGNYYKNGVPIEILEYQRPIIIDGKLTIDQYTFEECFKVRVAKEHVYAPNLAPEDIPEAEYYIIP